jgi:uncharacterized membrane protein
MTIRIPQPAGYSLLLILSLGVTAYAVVVYGLMPVGALVHPDMRAVFEANRVGIYTHVFASAVALGLGPLQLSARLRAARPQLHRVLGRLYLGIGVLVGGLAGLAMALHAHGGPASQAGFAGLALGWLYTGARAYAAIRRRDVPAHRRWMFRNFALTFAAVTLRLWLPAAGAAGIPFGVAYPAIAWLCWVPNLLVAEWLVGRGGSATAATTGPAHGRADGPDAAGDGRRR